MAASADDKNTAARRNMVTDYYRNYFEGIRRDCLKKAAMTRVVLELGRITEEFACYLFADVGIEAASGQVLREPASSFYQV